MKTSQEDKILDHLSMGQTLDPMNALKLFGCWALSSRVSDINRKIKEGKIDSPLIETKLVHAGDKTYAEYFIQYRVGVGGQLSLM